MNDKKIYDLKLSKKKINAAMALIEEAQNLLEDFPEVEPSHLADALEELDTQYWKICNLLNLL